MWNTAADSLLAALLLTAVVMDFRTARIPNFLTLGAILAGVLLNGAKDGFPGASFALWGAAAGVAVFFGPFILGGIGGGDVKLMAAVGAFQGPLFVGIAFLATALCGGLVALLRLAFRPAERSVTMARVRTSCVLIASGVVPSPEPEAKGFPYAVCIAFGAVAAWFLVPVARALGA